MSEPLKSTHVRLSAPAYAALTALAEKHGRKRSEMMAELLTDALLGRARGARIEIQNEPRGFIYVIRIGELCKIGKSKNPKARIVGMSLPEKPEIICAFEVIDRHLAERELHARFREYRQHGEWFRLPPEVLTELRGRATCL